jgi:superfamily II DNA or RNA helicase
VAHGIDAHYINFNSGNLIDINYSTEIRKINMTYRKIESSTTPNQARAEYEKAEEQRIPFIVISTYDSSVRFSESNLIPALTIHDEAHNEVSEENSKVATLASDADYFFTATMKVTDSENGGGMNDESKFGNMIYTKSAKEMIEKGEMVRPRIHSIRPNTTNTKVDIEKIDTDYSMIFKSIIDAFFAHDEKINTHVWFIPGAFSCFGSST